ncbi:Trk system potassium transport protein TrkA [Fulvitalea axinellae]|uniref:Trk system potassium uptake protein TrkA n=1 Tax=Fulvitalea axinellae TaxID=1182444 RepID=A0AAU9C743_9BACT|nr:Trk system potassium transport protein TrkA [Fulvitalea axinellae]
MHIIIAGAGNVGYYLAKQLAQEQHDIVLIDTDEERLQYVANHLDVATVHGNSTSFQILKEAFIDKTDLLICVTPAEETNLATAMIGKKLGAQRTISRISNTEFLGSEEKLDFRSLGIDSLICPATLAAREIKRLLREASLTETFEFDRGILSLVGIKVEEGDVLEGKTLKETASLNPDKDYIIVAILRDNKTIIPHGDTKIETNDLVYFVAEPTGVDRVYSMKKRARCRIRNIMIMGGSRTGLNAALKMEKVHRVKIIEKSREKCAKLAEQLSNTLVIHGDANDVELLEAEGIEDVDAFVAVTGNSETNIISCLMAKKHGVPKTIAMVENLDYIHLSQQIGVDTMINKKLIAANFISRYVRQGKIVSVAGIHGLEAEVVEFEVRDDSAICFQTLRDLDFPQGAVVGGVIRKGEGKTTTGDFTFQPNDRVVLLCELGVIKEVEKFF